MILPFSVGSVVMSPFSSIILLIDKTELLLFFSKFIPYQASLNYPDTQAENREPFLFSLSSLSPTSKTSASLLDSTSVMCLHSIFSIFPATTLVYKTLSSLVFTIATVSKLVSLFFSWLPKIHPPHKWSFKNWTPDYSLFCYKYFSLLLKQNPNLLPWSTPDTTASYWVSLLSSWVPPLLGTPVPARTWSPRGAKAPISPVFVHVLCG